MNAKLTMDENKGLLSSSGHTVDIMSLDLKLVETFVKNLVNSDFHGSPGMLSGSADEHAAKRANQLGLDNYLIQESEGWVRTECGRSDVPPRVGIITINYFSIYQ